MLELKQYGGDHYLEAGNLQHWDMLVAAGYGWEYYTGNASRYLSRVKESPMLDAQKSGHFLEKLIDLIDRGYMPDPFEPTLPRLTNFEDYLRRYYAANKIDPASDRATAIRLIMLASTRSHLVGAKVVVDRIISSLSPKAVQPDKPSPEKTPIWPFPTPVETNTAEDFAKEHLGTPFQSGGGGDFAGAGATGSFEEPAKDNDRVFMVGDTSNDPLPAAETCSRSDYSSSSSDPGSGGSSD